MALDFGGHGLSKHRDSYRYADYERDLVTLFDALGLDGVTVAGHSLGGYVALAAATRDERIGAVLAIDVKSDWSDEDAAFAERSRAGVQRVEPDRSVLLKRLARSAAPAEAHRRRAGDAGGAVTGAGRGGLAVPVGSTRAGNRAG